MLVLSRKAHEAIVIDGNIRIIIAEIKPGRVRIGIEAPPEVRVDREEVHESRQDAYCSHGGQGRTDPVQTGSGA